MRFTGVRPQLLSIGITTAFVAALSACTFGAGPEGYPPSATDVPAEQEAYPEPSNGEATEAPAGAGAAEEGLGGRRLLVGTDAEYPPFESVEDGVIVGFDPDLMQMLCQLADCMPEFQSTAWDGIFSALSAGEYDVLMSAITILPERETESGATFTDPYFSVGQVVLVRSDETAITGAADLPGFKVAVQTGTTGDTAATEDAGVPDENMQRFESNALAVQALLNGDVDAVVCDNPTAENYVAANEGQLMVVGDAFTVEDYGILVPNTAPEVLEALNVAIDRLKSQGEIDRLAEKWLTDTEPE